MDVAPTLDVVDGPYEEDSCEDEEEVWGRLFPLRKDFFPLSEHYTSTCATQCMQWVWPICMVGLMQCICCDRFGQG